MSWEIGLVAAYVGIGLVLLWMSQAMDKEHIPLKLAFFGFGLILLLTTLATNDSIITANNDTIGEDTANNLLSMNGRVYASFLYMLVFLGGYFIVYFIKKLYERFQKVKPGG